MGLWGSEVQILSPRPVRAIPLHGGVALLIGSLKRRHAMGEEARVLGELRKQEETLQLSEFSNDTAIEIGTRLVAAARAAGQTVTIDIHRNGQQLFHCALP